MIDPIYIWDMLMCLLQAAYWQYLELKSLATIVTSKSRINLVTILSGAPQS